MNENNVQDLTERLIRIETMLEILNKQFSESQPRLAYLERETERQKDSLKQAHNRISEQDKRFYWIIGLFLAQLLQTFFSSFF
jgi:capsule polysaccharide export protein KpsE/RkpR